MRETDRQRKRCIYKQKHRQTNGWMDEQTNRHIWIDRVTQRVRQADRRMYGQTERHRHTDSW